MFEGLSLEILLIYYLLAIALLGLLLYYFVFFIKLAIYKLPNDETQNLPPVSVIIAARNEYQNLQQNLIKILEQDYPNFEVIVVNHCSWDESQKLLEYYMEKYPNLKVCKINEQENYPTGKKFALTIGIKAAKHHYLVFTDADCIPASKNWLKRMASGFNKNNTEIVLGHSPYINTKSILNLFARFENAVTAMLYFNAALHKMPFMGIGRNLAYTKELFFKNKGFASHSHLLSGDDDMFVNETANAVNTNYVLHPDSFMYSPAKKTFSDYARQKSRHLTTGKYYKTKHKVLLGAYYSFLILFYASFLLALALNYKLWIFPVAVLSLKFLVQTAIFTPNLIKLKYKDLAWFLLILDFVYVLYIVYFGTKALFTRNAKRW